jgi:hypothetical protein
VKSISGRLCLVVLCVGTLACASALWADPPNRVGRLNYLSGTVSFHPETVDDWAPATLNYPLTIGDQLWTDQDGQAELHVGSTAIRLASSTQMSFLNLNDQTIQIRLSTGSLNVRLRQLGATEQIELDTPNSSLELLRAGVYRVDVGQNGDTTVTVRVGEVEVTAGSSVSALRQKQRATITGVDSPEYQVGDAPAADDWDKWCRGRDQKENKVASAQYVPSAEMSGVEDLDQYGSWSEDPDYGPVWTPSVVVAGWAPYGFGHWAWVDPWGWTWIDDAPWGFAPFHYGRWAYRNNAWAWVPGAHIGRAVYAPALVAFVGGGGWHCSAAPGGGVGWFALGPHEPYLAAYRTNSTRQHNVDIQHIAYANRGVAGAVIFVPNDAFVRGQPAAGSRFRPSEEELSRAPMRGAVAPMAPEKESFLGGYHASHGPVAHPPDSVMSRSVVARLTPPPRTASFESRQQALAAHPGQPLDAGTALNLRGAAPDVRSPVRVVSPGYSRRDSGQHAVSPRMSSGENGLRRSAEGQAGTDRPRLRQQMEPAAGQERAGFQSRQPPIEGQPRSSGVAPHTGSSIEGDQRRDQR